MSAQIDDLETLCAACAAKIDMQQDVPVIKVSLSAADVSRLTGWSIVHSRKVMSEGLIESVLISASRGRKHFRCSPVALKRFIDSRSTRSE
jgi:hypothetical protein